MPTFLEMQPTVVEVARRLRERPVRIAVVGDIILDNSIEGEPGGLHPEFKIPIITTANNQESIGGAANTAQALSRLGADVTLFGIIGSDLPGRQLESLLDRQPFAHYLITEKGWPTPRKDWLSTRDENGLFRLVHRIDYDRPLPGHARHELVGEFRARCPAPVDVVVLADHGVGSIAQESLALIGLAKEHQAKLVAVPRSTVLRGQPLDAIILNSTEMRRLAQAGDLADARQLACRYAREHRQQVYLTLFEEGLAVCISGQSEPLLLDFPEALDRPDWMGVRDITTAVVALGLALELDPGTIGRLAMVFRRLVAGQRGNGRVFWRDVYRQVGLDASTAPGHQ